jgi:hypothetical protein
MKNARVYFNWPNAYIRIHRIDCHEAQNIYEGNTGVVREYSTIADAFAVARAFGPQFGIKDVRGCMKCAPASN